MNSLDVRFDPSRLFVTGVRNETAKAGDVVHEAYQTAARVNKLITMGYQEYSRLWQVYKGNVEYCNRFGGLYPRPVAAEERMKSIGRLKDLQSRLYEEIHLITEHKPWSYSSKFKGSLAAINAEIDRRQR